MPKINVYLPDDLADVVRETGIPVSAICQRALEASVRRVTAIRQATLGEVPLDDPGGRMAHFTAKARAAVGLAVRTAHEGGSGAVGTEHLLAGLLADRTNLAMAVLTSMEIEPAAVLEALNAAGVTREPEDETTASGGGLRFTGPAVNALELAVTEAISMGHNYIGCEHLLLGVATETEGTGGVVLRDLGADPRPVRRAIAAALAGYTAISASKQAQAPAAQSTGTQSTGTQSSGIQAQMLAALRQAVQRELQPFAERLDRLEERLGPEGTSPRRQP